MIRLWSASLLSLPILSLILATAGHAQLSSGDSPKSPEFRLTIAGSTHALANPARDVGAVDGSTAMERMVLVLSGTAEQEHQLRMFLDAQQTKGSPEYHRWLTPEEFGTRFGAARQNLQQARDWLEQQGFSIGRIGRSGRWIEFSGVAAQVEAAFRTQMRHYQVGGKIHTANATDISIPASLFPAVRGVLSLHDFTSRPMLASHYVILRDSAGKFVPASPAFTTSSGAFHFLTPNDYATIYDLSSLYQAGTNGGGQTIAIVARSNIDLADVEVFRQIFGLPANDPNIILSGPDPGYVGDDALESSLDTEWAGALAPNATVKLVAAASTVTTDGVALSAAYIVDNNLADVVNVSYSACEQNLGTAGNAFYNALWQQAAAQGMSVAVSAGDNGPAGCDDANDPNNTPAHDGLGVNGLASTPFDTAVGGTEFDENGNDATFWNSVNEAGFSSVLGYIPEEAWNESCDPTTSTTCINGLYSLYAGSGGVSTVYSKPSWQSASGVPADGQRDLPDLSMAAAGGHDGYLVCSVGSCLTTPDGNLLEQATVVGGTSAAAPSFAGILALVDQKLGSRQGLANFVLYPLASQANIGNCNSSARTNPSVATQCAFNDVTAGNNSIPGQTGYSASAGFDLATGLGSVNAANLVNTWNSVTLQGSMTDMTIPNATAVHGQPVPVTVSVGSSSGTGVPSGSFVLMSDKYGPAGVGTLTNGAFSGSFAALPGGQYNLTAHYQGDGTFANSDSLPVPVSIGLENSAISVASYTYTSTGPISTSSVPFGDFLYLHAAVASSSGNGVATGTVTFLDDSHPIGSITLNSKGEGELVSGGSPQLGAALALPVGSHSITATYSGDNSLNPSTTGQPLVLAITKGTAFLPVSSSQTTIMATQQLLLHVSAEGSVSSVPPTGTIQFTDGGALLGQPISLPTPLPETNPEVSYQVSLAAGSHTISATYSGDSNYNPGPALNSIAVTVSSAVGNPTQTTLSGGSSSSTVGDIVNYTVSVSGTNSSTMPTGTVQLMNGELGSLGAVATLVNGSAMIPMQWSFGGNQTLSAQYSGDSNFAASASTPITVSVQPLAPSITLTASSATVNSGTQVSLTATVAVSTRPMIGGLAGISGQIQFFDSLNGGVKQAIGPPVQTVPTTVDPVVTGWFGFVATSTLAASLKDGTHTITAQYLGNSIYFTVISSPVTVTVGSRTSAGTTLSVDSKSPAYGQMVNFTARVSSGLSSPSPTGMVSFVNSMTGVFGTAPLQTGVATLAIPWNVGGMQTVYAQYSGDSNYSSSNSDPVTITLPTFEFTGEDNQLAIPAGTSAAVPLTVTPIAGFNSIVNFSCGSGFPAGSTCSMFPSSVTLAGTSSQSSVFVLSTTAASTTAEAIPKLRKSAWQHTRTAVELVAMFFIIVLPAGRRKRTLVAPWIALGLLIILAACGGGGGGGGTGGGSGGGGGGGGGGSSPATSTTVLTSSAIKTPAGSSVTFTAKVSSTATTITGSVIFYDGSTPIGQSTISSGQAQLVVSSLSVGTHSVSAAYGGDSENTQSTSSTLYEAITGSIQFPVTATGAGQTQTIMMTVLIE